MKSDAITLQDIVRNLPEVRSISGASVSVSGVAHDSRDVRSGDMFVCLVGSSFDGHRFVAEAVRNGATALLIQSDRSAADISHDIPHITVDDTRSALPLVASCVYGRPSRKLKLFGVTGTNGKTTTTLLLERILRQRGWKTGVIGTLGSSFMGDPIPSEHTTPEADQLQFLLREMLLRGGDAVVMEVSSHAIAMKRTLACEFDGAVFTNLTQDHLDFHSTMEEYFQTKLRLFAEYPLGSAKAFHASVNMDDPYGKRILSETKGDVVTYAVHNDAILTVRDIHYAPHQTRFVLRTSSGECEVTLQIGGAFQVSNALAAAGVAWGIGMDLNTIAEGLGYLPAAPGRFESVQTGRDFHLIVDYAHTPDGLRNLLISARELSPKKILLVFGCGGDRDRTKRPVMARIASEYADRIFITSDNPRHEDPMAIIEEICVGVEDKSACAVIPDRREAIGSAIHEAKKGDLVILAGKGHEDYQIIGDNKIHFDDREVARELLEVS